MKYARSPGSTRSAFIGIAGTIGTIALLYLVGALTLGAAFGL